MAEKQKRNNKKTVQDKSQEKLGWRIVLFAVWLAAGLYFGIASWTKINYDQLVAQAQEAQSKVNCDDPNHIGYQDSDGIEYCTLEDSYAADQLTLMEQIHLDWIFYLPDPLPFILSAFSFGILGAMVRIIRTAISVKGFPELHSLLQAPVLGGITAIMLLGISYIFPSLFTDANILLKPQIQPFLSLFAGAFSEQIQKWFQAVMEKNFKIEKEKK
jgi:hypothetical protein